MRELQRDADAGGTRGGLRDAGQEADTAPKPFNCGTSDYVRDLQCDLRLLTQHVARRADRGFDNSPAAAAAAGRTGALCDQDMAELLTLAPPAIAADPARLARLVTSTDALSRRVRPANVNTIRLTCAYVGTSEYGALPKHVYDEARSVKAWMLGIACVGILALLLAVMLLVHASNGRSIIRDLELQRVDLRVADTEVAQARQALAASLPTLPPERKAAAETALRQGIGCPPAGEPPDPALAPVCGRKSNAERQMSVTYARLKTWNAISDRLSYVAPLRWLAPPPVLSGDLTKQDWKTTELRTAGSLFALTAFVLPMLLGFVGACAYVYRRTNDKIEDWALEARDKWHSVLRVLLGLTLGGLLGALFTAGEPMQIQGVSLSLAAIAFFVGYAVQVVFTMLDGVIRAVSGKVKTMFAPAS